MDRPPADRPPADRPPAGRPPADRPPADGRAVLLVDRVEDWIKDRAAHVVAHPEDPQRKWALPPPFMELVEWWLATAIGRMPADSIGFGDREAGRRIGQSAAARLLEATGLRTSRGAQVSLEDVEAILVTAASSFWDAVKATYDAPPDGFLYIFLRSLIAVVLSNAERSGRRPGGGFAAVGGDRRNAAEEMVRWGDGWVTGWEMGVGAGWAAACRRQARGV
jgi:hypothetical protein